MLVTVNDRIGPPDFLSPPTGLDVESPRRISGCYGAREQIAGLK